MNYIQTGLILNILRFCVDDGPGIRTTVFLKGCPLSCIWCHNPEAQSFQKELFYDNSRCVNCQACINTCPNSCHGFDGDNHLFNRTNCNTCGKCAVVCIYGALRNVGMEMTVDKVVEVISRDMAFYNESGGGVTLSGGEPLAQPDFSTALLKAVKELGINTCVETCGYSSKEFLLKIASHTDIFLYDIKHMDNTKHFEYTQVDNSVILSNLFALDNHGAKLILRLPIIPECNDTDNHFRSVGELSMKLKNLLQIEIMPYHPLGISKLVKLDKVSKYNKEILPEQSEKNYWLETMKKYTSHKVICN